METPATSPAVQRHGRAAPWAWRRAFAVLLPILLVATAAGWAIYQAGRDSVARITFENLEAVAKVKAGRVESWLERGRQDARLATETPLFAGELQAWLKGKRRDDALRDRLAAHLQPLLRHYSDVSLRDAADGSLLLTRAAKGEPPAEDSAPERALAAAAAREKAAKWGELHGVAGHEGHLALNLLVPVAASDGARPLAVLDLALDPSSELYAYLQRWPGTSPSGETLWLAADGDDLVYLNPLRHRPDPPLSLRLPKTAPDLLGARVAASFAGGIRGLDYRQVPSLGYSLPVAGTPWFLVAKVDAAEAYATLNGFALVALGLAALFFLAALWWLAEHEAGEARIERLSRLHAALSAVNNAVARSASLAEVFEAACRACVIQGGFKLAWLGQADAAGRRIEVRHAFGQDLAYLDGLRVDTGPDMPEGRGPTATAFRDGRTYVCRDIGRDTAMAPWRQKAARHRLRSSIALPVVAGGAVRGVLTVYGEKIDCFGRQAMRVLEEIAETLAFAIRHFADEAEKRKVAAALRESEARLQEAQKIGKIGHFNCDLDSGAMSWSPQLFALFGREPKRGPADLEGLAEHYLPESARRTAAAARQAITTGERVALEQEVRFADGRLVHHATVIIPSRDEHGRTIALHGTVQDITEHKLSERRLAALAGQLERAGSELADLYENAPCGYHSLDKDGVFRRINDTELKWLGYAREEVIGKMRLTELLNEASLPTFQRTFPRLIETGEVRDVELELVRRDGSILPVLVGATTVRDAAGGFVMTRSTVYDMSERRKMEQERAAYARRLEMLSRHLVAVQEEARRRLSGELHDRTSPNLAAIGVNLRVIAEALPELAPELAARLEDTEGLVEDTTASIREISADLRPPVLDYAGLLPALEGYARQFSRRTGIPVHLDCADASLRLPAETESMLFRIAQEALTNCAKHAGASSIRLALSHAGQPVVMTVMDDGIGFDPDMLGKIGHIPGLGILNMREMAEFAGGRLEIDSRPGAGTRVQVEI